jgi:hypothetical protein
VMGVEDLALDPGRQDREETDDQSDSEDHADSGPPMSWHVRRIRRSAGVGKGANRPTPVGRARTATAARGRAASP